MAQRLLLIGDLGEDDRLFSSICHKLFSSTLVFTKKTIDEPDVFLSAKESDMVFIRIDQNYRYGIALSNKLKRDFPKIHVVWIATNSQYALPAFENNMDGYFELPVTEAKLETVKKRLNVI